MTAEADNFLRVSGAWRRKRRPSIALAISVTLIFTANPANAGALHDAVRTGDFAAAKSAVAEGSDVNETDFILGTPLHVAVSEGRLKMVEMLVDHGADVEAVSEQQGSRALHLAAQFGHADIAALLIKEGANTDAGDSHHNTPLHRAAKEGHLYVVRLLLEQGAIIDKRESRYGWTALHEAAHHGRLEVVELLLSRGADVRAVDNSGWSPFSLAATPMSFGAGDGPKLLELLAKNGADIHINDNSGMSVLAHAEDRLSGGFVSYKEIAEVLRRLGAPP